MVQEGKALIFPKGETILKPVEVMSFSLANFRGDKVGLTIKAKNREIAFNLRTT